MSLHLLYTNDLHGRSAPLARLEEFRRGADSLLLDGGDALRGSNTAIFPTEPNLEWMRRLGYRAMAMGNREFHYFRWVQRWREQEREFPLLACNCLDLTRPQQNWRPTLEFTQSGLKVALVGITPPQFPEGSRWEKLTGFRFLDLERVLPPLLEELRPRCDVLIMLSHLGLSRDLDWAARGLPVDLILGGHSHDLTPEPLWRGRTAVIQGGAFGRFLAELEWNGPSDLQCRFHPCA